MTLAEVFADRDAGCRCIGRCLLLIRAVLELVNIGSGIYTIDRLKVM